MTCGEAKLRAQALIDNEVEEQEIPEIIHHMESCYRCREDYIELLKIQRRLQGLEVPEPPKEWFEDMPKRIARRSASLSGKILFFGSYLFLLVYALITFFRDGAVSVLVRLAVGGIFAGLVVLLGVTIADRLRERKTDKYRGVMK